MTTYIKATAPELLLVPSTVEPGYIEQLQQNALRYYYIHPTNNALLINFLLSSDAEISLMSTE